MTEEKYYRYAICRGFARHAGYAGGGGHFAWEFSLKSLSEVQKEHDVSCKEINEKYKDYHMYEYVYMVHEITKEDFGNRIELSLPINQYIFRIAQ